METKLDTNFTFRNAITLYVEFLVGVRRASPHTVKAYTSDLLQFEQWMQEQIQQVPPKSKIAKAMAYSLNLWDRLIRYTENGDYLIDNNLIENTIRPVALGRKNYLFAGSHNAAQNAAMMYSFFGTCKLQKIEPYHWLTTTLERIPNHKINRLAELLPGYGT